MGLNKGIDMYRNVIRMLNKIKTVIGVRSVKTALMVIPILSLGFMLPGCETLAATNITATTAQLNGTTDSTLVLFGAYTVEFEYGLTAAYGTTVAADQSPITLDNGTTDPVSVVVTGLTCNTLYHYRSVSYFLVAGAVGGVDMTFTTSACPTTADLTVVINGRGTVRSGDGLINCRTTCTQTYTLGDTLTLTATPDDIFYFRNWFGDCAGQGRTCTITMTAATTVEANFRKYVETTETENQSPSTPSGGSDWLIFPEDGLTGIDPTTGLVWKLIDDPDGDTVSYQLWVCADGDFDNCTPTTVTATQARMAAAGASAVGAGLLLFGLAFTRQGRRKMMVIMAVFLIASSGALIACGVSSSDSSSSDAETYFACLDASADEVCDETEGLLANTEYSWKVVAYDGNGGSIESSVRTFTTGE